MDTNHALLYFLFYIYITFTFIRGRHYPKACARKEYLQWPSIRHLNILILFYSFSYANSTYPSKLEIKDTADSETSVHI